MHIQEWRPSKLAVCPGMFVWLFLGQMSADLLDRQRAESLTRSFSIVFGG